MAITKTKAATECHIRSVYQDPEYIKEFKKLGGNPNSNELFTELLSRFGLEPDDFDMRSNGFMLFSNPDNAFSAGWLKYMPERQEFEVSFSADIKEDQFKEELWKLVQKNRKKFSIKTTRNKPPQEDKLLYAVFKAKIKGDEFKEIFDNYQKGKLYKGNHSTFTSEPELEKYYHRHYKAEL